MEDRQTEEIPEFGRVSVAKSGISHYVEPPEALPAMGHRACCRNCRHCSPPAGQEPGWCQLRRLPIHAELAGELWCHHWTARPPRLPQLGSPQSPEAPLHNRQLALADLLES